MDEQLDLFGDQLPWEEATIEKQEERQLLTPAQKKELNRERIRTTIVNYMREWNTPLSAFEVSERLRVMKTDIKPEQVRAAMRDLKNYGVLRQAGKPDPLATSEFSATRYTVV